MLKNHLNRLFIDAFSFVPTEGQRVLFDKVALFIAGEESFSIMSVSGLGSGMYILSVESAGQLITTKRLSIVK